MSGQKYTIEARTNSGPWKFQASFTEGDPSRYGKPFDEEIAIKEAKDFKNIRANVFDHVRLIIEL